MRTKTLFLTAAAALVSFAVTAQVVSVNVVGFVNKQLPAGFTILNNPLVAGDNKVETVLPAAGLDDYTEIYKWDGTSYSGYNQVIKDFGGWQEQNMTLAPGEGFWLNLPAAKTITFVGEVKQGNLTTPVPVGFTMVGSQVPQAGKLQADLSFAPNDLDTVYQWANNTWANSQFTFGEWQPADPEIAIGEGFFVERVSAGQDWTRNFQIQP